MQRDDWMLFILTFLTAVAIGMYVYVAAFKPEYEGNDDETPKVQDWTIVGWKIGKEIEPTFRLYSNGKYEYWPQGRDGEVSQGRLSQSLVNSIQFDEVDLSVYGEEVETEGCLSERGGIDFEYRVTLGEEITELNTCTTDFPSDSALASSLRAIWSYLEGNRTRNISNPSDWAEDWIRKNFGTD